MAHPAAPAPIHSSTVISRGRSLSRSISPTPCDYFRDPSLRGQAPPSVTIPQSALRRPPSPSYVPPHIVRYRCGGVWPDMISSVETATPSLDSRVSPSRSRSRSPVHDHSSRSVDGRSPSRRRIRYYCGRSPSPMSDRTDVRSSRNTSRSTSREMYRTPGRHTFVNYDSSPRSRSPKRSSIGMVSPQTIVIPSCSRACPVIGQDQLSHVEVNTPAEPPLLVNIGDTVVTAREGGPARTASMSSQSRASFKLPPLSLDQSADLFCEFWPHVTQEFRHLLQELPVDVTRIANDGMQIFTTFGRCL